MTMSSDASYDIECIIPRNERFDGDYVLNGSMENMPSDKDSGVYSSEGATIKAVGDYFKLTHHITKRTFALAKITKTFSLTFAEFSDAHQKAMLEHDKSFKPDTRFTQYQYDIVADVVPIQMERTEWLFGSAFLVLASKHRLAPKLNGRFAINPITHAQLPIYVDDYARTDVYLGVPAHNEADRAFAKAHDLPIIPVVAQDFGEPLDNAKDVSGVVVIGYDPKSGQFMGLKNGKQGWLVGGGHEDGESYEESAIRELREEAGFSKLVRIIALGDPVYSYYYNDIKRSNRRSLGYNFLAILNKADQGEQQQEAHESFTVWWTDFASLYQDIAKTGGGVEHWLEALKRAKAVAEDYARGVEQSFACYAGEGTMVNAGAYHGMSSKHVREAIADSLRDTELHGHRTKLRTHSL